MYSRRYERFWHVNRISKNETRIIPNIPEIQNELKCRKDENLESKNKRIRIINQVDTVHAKRSAINSLSLSAGAEVRAKRANPDEKSS